MQNITEFTATSEEELEILFADGRLSDILKFLREHSVIDWNTGSPTLTNKLIGNNRCDVADSLLEGEVHLDWQKAAINWNASPATVQHEGVLTELDNLVASGHQRIMHLLLDQNIQLDWNVRLLVRCSSWEIMQRLILENADLNWALFIIPSVYNCRITESGTAIPRGARNYYDFSPENASCVVMLLLNPQMRHQIQSQIDLEHSRLKKKDNSQTNRDLIALKRYFKFVNSDHLDKAVLFFPKPTDESFL